MLRSGGENDAVVEASPSTSKPRSEIRVKVTRWKSDDDDSDDDDDYLEQRDDHLRQLCDFWREGKYVDVTLKFDDGGRLSCHRAILASHSRYFDSLFSNGWKETKEEEIHLKGDSSQSFGLALEFIYVGTCTVDVDDFMEVLLLADKYDIKVLQDRLQYEWEIKSRDDCNNMQGFEMWLKVWVFCREYSVIAESIESYKYFKGLVEQELYDYVVHTTIDQLTSSEAFDLVDDQCKFDFLGAPLFGASTSFKIASAWLQKRFGRPNPVRADEMGQFDLLLASLKLDGVSLEQIHTTWGEDSSHTQRILSLRERQHFLIIPDVGEKGETLGFVCHQMETGDNFYLDLPTPRGSSRKFHGDPELCVVKSDELLCICGAQDGDGIFIPSRYAYSFFEDRWEKYGSYVDKVKRTSEVNIRFLRFLAPPYSGRYRGNLPIVRLGHDFKRKNDDEEEEKLVRESGRESTREPHRNVVKVNNWNKYRRNFEFGPNFGACPNFEVSGVGVNYVRLASYDLLATPPVGVVVFGNTYVQEGQSRKKSMTLLDAKTATDGFPDGACECPLSVVSFDDVEGQRGIVVERGGIYVTPSAPFTVVDDQGDGDLKLISPRVWIFKRQFRAWQPLPTPSCPDLDYSTLYYDVKRKKLCLILVQKPLTDAPFSSVYDRDSYREQREPTEKSKEGKNGDSPTRATGRIVGRFVLNVGENLDYHDMNNKDVSDVWSSLPVTDTLADFLALGSRLPGEVRITSAPLNFNHLRPVKLVRVPIGDGPDFNVVVAKEGTEPTSSTNRLMTPWLKHEDSPFHNVKSTDIEAKLNACAKEDKTLFDSLKNRRLAYPFIPDAPMVPYSPKNYIGPTSEHRH